MSKLKQNEVKVVVNTKTHFEARKQKNLKSAKPFWHSPYLSSLYEKATVATYFERIPNIYGNPEVCVRGAKVGQRDRYKHVNFVPLHIW